MISFRGIWGVSAAIAAVTAVYVWGDSGSPFPNLALLPTTYLVTTAAIVLTVDKAFRYTITERLLVCMLFLRYVLLPIAMQASGEDFYTNLASLTEEEMSAGVRLMAYEGVVAFVVFAILRRLFLAKHRRRVLDETTSRISKPGSQLLYSGLIAIGLATLILPEVRERFSFFSSAIDGTAREIVAGYSPAYDGLAAISNLARFAIPIALIAWAIGSRREAKSMTTVMLACVGIIAANMFYVSTSRASFFIPLLASVFALRIALPEQRRTLTRFMGGALALTTTVVTLRKSLTGGEESSLSWLADYLSIYLMGPQEYAVGLRAVSSYDSSVHSSTFFNDLFGNVPILSGLADLTDRTSQLFNWSYVGSSASEGGAFIVPSSIQGAFYLTHNLGPLAVVFGLFVAVIGERQLLKDELTASNLYLGAFAVVTGVVYYTNSVSNLMALVSFPVVPLLMLGWIDARGSDGLRKTATAKRPHSRSAAG